MIWEHSGVFNAKENFCLTPQGCRLENPRSFPPHCTFAPGQEFFSALFFHDLTREL